MINDCEKNIHKVRDPFDRMKTLYDNKMDITFTCLELFLFIVKKFTNGIKE